MSETPQISASTDLSSKEVFEQKVFERLQDLQSLRQIVVGVIGPRDATEEQLEVAEQIGAALGKLGVTLICGGREGIMEAVSKGCHNSDGLMVGMLPGSESGSANQYVDIPLPTGLGEARNMIIAKSSRVLIAVGSSYGTLSEIAYGLHFSKPVIGVAGAPGIEGVILAEDAGQAIQLALQALLDSLEKTTQDANV